MKKYRTLFIAVMTMTFYFTANADILDPDTIVIPTVNEYAKDLSTLDIKFTMPDGFKPVKLDDYFGLQYYKPWPGRADVANWGYSMILESNDEQGALLYPIIVPDKPIITFGDQMESELRHMNPGTKDITPLLTFVTEDDMSGYANADTAVIYSFDIKGPVLGKYPHIIGILLRKYAHQTMFLKIALSDEGLKHKGEYIKALLGSLKYGNNNSEKMVERERVIATDCDLKFPHPQRYGGILAPFQYYINGKQKYNEKRTIYKPKLREKNAQGTDFSPLYHRLQIPNGNYNESDYDVVIKAPAGYELINDSVGDFRGFVVAEPTGDANGTACIHPMVYKSSDENALLLFPLLEIDNQHMDGYLEYEAHCVSGDPYSEISGTFQEFTRDEAIWHCNADKGAIYEVKLRKPFVKAYKSGVDKYDYCIGVYFEKYLHPVLRMKILLTEDGYKEKEKHINALLSCFNYGDSAPEAAKKANDKWEEYARKLKSYDVEMKRPGNFHALDTTVFNPRILDLTLTNRDKVPVYYDLALESDDNNAMLLYPYVPSRFYDNVTTIKKGRYIQDEIRVAVDNPDFDVNGRVEILRKDDLSATEEADTIAVYRLPLKRQIFNRYNNCVGVYLRKYAHPGLLFKLLLTDEGLKNLDGYLKILRDNVVYGDTLKLVKYGNNPNEQLLNMEQNFAIQDFQFPSPFIASEGLFRPDPALEALSEVWHEGGQEATYFLTGGDSERVVQRYKTKVMMHKFMTGSDLAPVDSILQLYWDKGGKEAQETINKVIGKNN